MSKDSRLSNPATLWFRHDRNDTSAFTQQLADNKSNTVLKRLREIFLQRLLEIEQDERTSKYEEASWAYKQAHLNGQKQEIFFLVSLLSFMDEDDLTNLTQRRKRQKKQ